MPFYASAPGKVVLLGEYAVLDGSTALVMACRQRCRAQIGPSPDDRCHLTTLMPDPVATSFAPGTQSGSALIDRVLLDLGPTLPWPAWSGTVDSAEFFAGGLKLGLGSSAAALVAFAGAVHRAVGRDDALDLNAVIRCHRRFQGGSGSGIDVAAAYAGGTVEFRLDSAGDALISSVRLPKSVGFAGVFAGGSASTPGLVGKYRQWIGSGEASAVQLRRGLFDIAARGCAAAHSDDGAAFVAAMDEYGRCLAQLGREIGADLVTVAHAQIGELAASCGLAYKVSGAGGGDVGIACGLDADALRAFSRKAVERGFHVVPLAVDEQGLAVEERAE